MVAGKGTPDALSTNLFASSFKVAATCFSLIFLASKFDTGWLSDDARIIIVIGLFCSTVTNNNKLLNFSVKLDFKNL